MRQWHCLAAQAQGLVEYAIVILFMILVALTAVATFGTSLRSLYGGIGSPFPGS